jgi:uncharacterized protein YkvS
MKNKILIILLALLGATQMAAQEYEYVPFVREGVKWVYSYTNVDMIDDVMDRPADPNLGYGTVYLTLELKGDTVINGKTYKAMHKYYGDAINTVNDTIPVYLREEDKVVYGIVLDGKTYPDCPIGRTFDSIIRDQIRNGEEFVLYDFQNPESFWNSIYNWEGGFELVSSDLIQIGAHLAKRYVCSGADYFIYIEGVGVDTSSFGYTLFPLTPILVGTGDVKFEFRYLMENDEIVYEGFHFEGPKPSQDDYEYVPFVREGVKWVYSYTNEDVMDRPADPNLEYGTVYLTLELKGDTVINGKTYKAMHKYYGDAINTVNDTIPVYLREEDKVVYGIVPDGKTYDDCPIGRPFGYSILRDKIRNGEEFVLYDFQDPESFWNSIYDWEGGFELESSDLIQIGAHLAKRYVCSGADYFIYIEGVGVDTRSFGYTLFPNKQILVGTGDVKFKFRYLMENDEIVYEGFHFEGPKPSQDDYEYVPFVREGVKWFYYYNNPFLPEIFDMDFGVHYYSFEVKGDFENGGKHYKQVSLTHYLDEDTKEIESFIPVYLREEDKVVYAIHPDGIWYPQCPVGFFSSVRSQEPPFTTTTEEFILYDFNNPVVLYGNNEPGSWAFYQNTDTISFGSYHSKRHHYQTTYTENYECGDDWIVEGIGYDGIVGMPLFYFELPVTGLQVDYHLSHVIEDGEIIYKGRFYDPNIRVGVNETMADKTRRNLDPQYYNLMGQPVGKEVPTTPGIYIHQGKKICVSRMP